MDKVIFQFTRHLLSCNNISLGNKYYWGKDFEPGGTVYGIFETIKYSQGKKSYFNFNHVYVSNLYRTWITAVLLYGTHVDSSETLHLYISPYLKEKDKFSMGITIKRGNFPMKITHMASKFLKFLEEMYNYFTNTSRDKMYREIMTSDWYERLPNTIVIHLPPNGNKTQEMIYVKSGIGMYTLTSFCRIKDLSGPKSGKEFTKYRKFQLKMFMNWFNSGKNYYQKKIDHNNRVHVVAHSNIMREYLNMFNIKGATQTIPFDINAIKHEYLGKVRNSNSWHFITTLGKELEMNTYDTIEDAVKDFELVDGVPINKPLAKSIEKKYRDTTLCGSNGKRIRPSPNICMNGGRTKIRKRKKRKTKKNMIPS